MEPIVFWTAENSLLGQLFLAASSRGLCRLTLGAKPEDIIHAWLARVMRPSNLVRRRTRVIEQALDELAVYASGGLRIFQTALDLRGTSFQRRVWAEVARIPFGATSTYGAVAAKIGRPTAVRAVGAANGANPLPLFVPCHRVIGANGELRGYGGGLKLKETLLQLEKSSPL